MLAGLKPSVGTVGDALDNGLAETTIGRYKTECVRDGSPFRSGSLRTLVDLEHITSAWVSTTRLGSCTALAAVHPPRSRLSTTLISRSGSIPITHNEVCINPRDASSHHPPADAESAAFARRMTGDRAMASRTPLIRFLRVLLTMPIVLAGAIVALYLLLLGWG